MAKRETTPSFIVELPLKTSASAERDLLIKLDSGRQLYNACLGEALRRLSLMRQSRQYKEACNIPKEDKEDRKTAFTAVRARFELKASAIQSFAIRTKNACHIGDHLDAHTTQKVGSRAFDAVMKYAVGMRGKPRFKGKGQFDSLESKTNNNGIKFRDGWVLWNGLELECLIDPRDEVVTHGLSCPIKYCRIVRRKIKDCNSFFIQLIAEGQPLQKHKAGEEVVGIDIGPSTIAYVAETKADLKLFCAELKPVEKEIRVLQRKLDRQRRANNPDNFNPDGTIRKGIKLIWHDSTRYKETKVYLSELHRVQASYRKSLHGRLANEIIGIGTQVVIEDLSYKAFQKMYGKSIGKRAPSLFVSTVARKAESAGGYLRKIPTRSTKLSQTCVCGKVKKKPLSERWHICDCGVTAQRDLFSGFLATCVNEQNILDTSMAQELWKGAEPLLRQTVSGIIQSAKGKALPSSFGLSRRQSGSSAYPRAAVGIAECEAVNVRYVVAELLRESPEEAVLSTGTPGL
jgi:putative transposase